jgi:hypothetical protein
MIADELRSLLRKQPFTPICVHLKDGSTYEVRSPEMALVTSEMVNIGFESEPGSGIADDFKLCQVKLIDRLELTLAAHVGPC